MYLSELIDNNYGFNTDSLTGSTFGANAHLMIVGWSGRYKTMKLYIVQCRICKFRDDELFGDGHFKCMLSNLTAGQTPCGCSNKYRWSESQWFIKVQRSCNERGYDFLGFSGDFKGKKTKLRLSCHKHGIWESTNIDGFLNTGYGCNSCGVERATEASKQPDDEAIQDFLASGAYHPSTKFWRSERTDKKGKKTYWNIHCPVCNTQAECVGSLIKQGTISCACSKSRQREAYIHIVYDGEIPIALKYGIANKSKRRLTEQNCRSIFNLKSFGAWEFPDKRSCLKAERTCKKSLVRQVVSKEEMKDGYSETTTINNIDAIIEIYESLGGVRIFNEDLYEAAI